MRRKDQFDRDALHFAPFCLFPSPFPRDEYENAIKLQPVINELMHKVAHDYNFLKESLKLTIERTLPYWNDVIVPQLKVKYFLLFI